MKLLQTQKKTLKRKITKRQKKTTISQQRSNRGGAQLERIVASTLGASLTRSSGNQNHDGDIILNLNNIRIECKDTDKTGSYILKKTDFKKHWADCLNKGAIPVWAIRTKDMPVICIIELNEFNDIVMELERLRRCHDTSYKHS